MKSKEANKILIIIDQGRVWNIFCESEIKTQVIVEHTEDQVIWEPPCYMNKKRVDEAVFLAEAIGLTEEEYKKIIYKKTNKK